MGRLGGTGWSGGKVPGDLKGWGFWGKLGVGAAWLGIVPMGSRGRKCSSLSCWLKPCLSDLEKWFQGFQLTWCISCCPLMARMGQLSPLSWKRCY